MVKVGAAPVAFINAIEPGSPADRAGLSAVDLIVSLNGKGIRDHLTLQGFLAKLRELAMLSVARLEILKYDSASGSYSTARVELRVPPDPDVRLGISAGFEVVITSVPATGPAASAGLQPGEFIDAVNGRPIAEMPSVVEIDLAVARAVEKGQGLRLNLRRWKPLPAVEGEGQRLTFGEREVTLDLSSARATAAPSRP
jgi:S1-C subfamily serine protease